MFFFCRLSGDGEKPPVTKLAYLNNSSGGGEGGNLGWWSGVGIAYVEESFTHPRF